MPTIVLATGNPHKVQELRAIFAEFAGTGAASAGGAGRGISVIGLDDFPGVTFDEPVEHGTTFAENARIKAVEYARQIQRHQGIKGSRDQDAIPRSLDPMIPFLVLGDDSGIEIEALRMPDGTPRPGVISSHYSTDGRETGLTREQRDAANNARVLREMEGIPTEQRTARFVCCMCLVGVSEQGRGPRAEGKATDARSPSALGPEPSALLHQTRGTMEGRIGIPPRIPSGGNGFGYDPLFLVAAAPFNYTKTGAELTSAEKNALSHRGAAARAMVQWINTSFAR